jgi:hypothetical protein
MEVEMTEKTFEIEGSAGVVHQVSVRRTGGELLIRCTCEAGRNKMVCKHRLELLTEDETLQGWLPGSALSKQLAIVASAERAADQAKQSFAREKKLLGRLMEG